MGGRPKAYHIHIQLYLYIYLYIKRYAFGLLTKWYEDNATYDKYRRGKVYSRNRKYRREIYTLVIPSVSVFFSKMPWCQISEYLLVIAGILPVH